MNNPRNKLATLSIFFDFRDGKLAESVRQDVTRKWKGGAGTAIFMAAKIHGHAMAVHVPRL